MSHSRCAGYNLVALVVAFTVLSILLAAALPTISHMLQREREAELIFRGLQYAEAIRVFQTRHGRYPTELSELLEVEPRSIRQLWADPITGSQEWGLVLANSPQQATGVADPQDRRRGRRNRGGPARTRRPGDPRQPARAGGDTVTQAQIQGVHSTSEETAIRSFFGKEIYSEWKFTANLLNISVGPGGVATPRINLSMMGKAMPRWLAGAEFAGATADPFGIAGRGESAFGRDATQPFAGDDFGAENPFADEDPFVGQGGAFADDLPPARRNDPLGRNRDFDPFRGSSADDPFPATDPFGGDDLFGQDPFDPSADPFGVPETDNPFLPQGEEDDGS